jgi:hypothetical protein
VAGERRDAFRRRHIGFDLLFHAGFAIDPFDGEPFLGEQAFVIGDKFRQALERRRGFENKLFHLHAHFQRKC